MTGREQHLRSTVQAVERPLTLAVDRPGDLRRLNPTLVGYRGTIRNGHLLGQTAVSSRTGVSVIDIPSKEKK